jgi:hypothetical protein
MHYTQRFTRSRRRRYCWRAQLSAATGGPYLDQTTIDMLQAWVTAGAPSN